MQGVITARPTGHAVALAAGLLALLVKPPAPSAQQVPAEMAALYDELRIAIEMEDIVSITSRLTSLGRVQAAVGKGIVPSLNTIFGERENLAVEVRFDEANIVGDRALVVVTWALSGRTTETQDAWNRTMQRADILVRRDGAWQLLASDEVDSAALGRIADGIFEDPKAGLKIQAPSKWRLIPLADFKVFAMAVSPDVTAWVVWLATDVPGTFTAEQLARAQEDALGKLGPTLGLELRDTVMGPTTFAGRPAFSVRKTFAGADGIEVGQGLTYCIAGPTLYICGYDAVPPAAYARLAAEIERSLAATQVTGPEVSELPPEAGRIEGRKYINDTHGCEITAPEAWDIKIGQGEWKLQVSMRPPQGDSFITMGMIDLPGPSVTAEQAVLRDDNLTSRAFDQYEVIRQGDTKAGDLPAYESVTRFSFGEQLRQRWRIYLVDADRLFFLFADVTPVEAWDQLEPLVREALQSLRIHEAQPLQPPADMP